MLRLLARLTVGLLLAARLPMIGQWRGAAALPAMVKQALTFLPEIRADQVVVLREVAQVQSYLSEWGYAPQAVREVVHQIKPLAEFTIDHHFPIFINASTQHYQRILRSWEIGTDREQAARLMASDLYHEYRHAAYGEDEVEALKEHVALLTRWRMAGQLLIADPYILNLSLRLRALTQDPAPRQ